MQRHDITLRVNGEDHTLTVDSRRLLVEVLRDALGLTGTKGGVRAGSAAAVRCS